MDQDKEESKVKYTISKSENGRDIIQIDNDNKEESKISKEDAVKVVSKWAEGAKSKKKEIIIFCLLAVLVIIFLLAHNLRKFKDYDVTASYDRSDGAETTYMDFQNNLLRYSRDGAFYTNYNGELIWNYTYEMTNPRVDVCGNYVLIYDKSGTQIAIMTPTGFKQSIKTSMPIVDAHIAKQGTVGILMQDGGTGYIELCDVTGTVLASGELHMSKSGYPMSIDISDDGENLAVTQMDLGIGNVKTTIAFYNFGAAGKNKDNNIVATYSYSNQIFPKIVYLTNGNAVAFGNGEVVLFNNDSKVSVKKEYFPEGDIKKVVYNDKYFGYICDATNKSGEIINQLNVYSGTGLRRVQKAVDGTYTDISFMSNDEILLSNGIDVSIYTLTGIEKFKYTFDEQIYNILPGDGSKRYVFIKDGKTDMVRFR